MPTYIPNRFTTVKWEENEEEQAKVFSDLNKIYLIGLRGEFAQKKLSLAVTDATPQAITIFIQAQAFLDGQLELLDFLIGD